MIYMVSSMQVKALVFEGVDRTMRDKWDSCRVW